jgi:hypothetical protein
VGDLLSPYIYLFSKYLLAGAIQDTTSWEKPRTLDNLPSFLEKYSGNAAKLWSASKKNGAPHTIIVTAAGLRAADLARYAALIRIGVPSNENLGLFENSRQKMPL